MNVLSLFDGISCGYVALQKCNIPIDKYYSSEIDKYAIEISNKNFPNIIQLGDITNWKNWNIDFKTIDLLIGGSPCQGFTFAGKRLNLDDKRSKLFCDYVDILEHIKSLNPNIKFLLENVKMAKPYKEFIDDMLGIKGVLINSNLFSCQNRQRYYWTNIPLSELPLKNNIVLKDIVREEDNNDVKTFISKTHYEAWLKNYSNWKYCSLDEKAKPLMASYFKQPPHCPYIECNNSTSGFRRLSPIECERLQTLPDNYTLVVDKNGKPNSYTQRWKSLGNGWTVDVIAFIFNGLKK